MSHPHANVFVKVGTTMAKVHPENREKTQLLLERASKIPSVKQFRAAQMRRRDTRVYPKHLDGQSTRRYVEQYYAANASILGGMYADPKEQVADFFWPLSNDEQYAITGPEAIEEEIAA
jgi:hypothetical protein